MIALVYCSVVFGRIACRCSSESCLSIHSTEVSVASMAFMTRVACELGVVAGDLLFAAGRGIGRVELAGQPAHRDRAPDAKLCAAMERRTGARLGEPALPLDAARARGKLSTRKV